MAQQWRKDMRTCPSENDPKVRQKSETPTPFSTHSGIPELAATSQSLPPLGQGKKHQTRDGEAQKEDRHCGRERRHKAIIWLLYNGIAGFLYITHSLCLFLHSAPEVCICILLYCCMRCISFLYPSSLTFSCNLFFSSCQSLLL